MLLWRYMFTKQDLNYYKNLQRFLSKAKAELQGDEILAAADVLRWVGLLESRISDDIQKQEMMVKMAQGTEKIQSSEKITDSDQSKSKRTSKKSEPQKE